MIIFHRFLISTAILFCVAFATWEWLAFRRGGATRDLVVAAVFVVLAIALGFYLKNLKRFLKQR